VGDFNFHGLVDIFALSPCGSATLGLPVTGYAASQGGSSANTAPGLLVTGSAGEYEPFPPPTPGLGAGMEHSANEAAGLGIGGDASQIPSGIP
jgi:hypothetical protein